MVEQCNFISLITIYQHLVNIFIIKGIIYKRNVDLESIIKTRLFDILLLIQCKYNLPLPEIFKRRQHDRTQRIQLVKQSLQVTAHTCDEPTQSASLLISDKDSEIQELLEIEEDTFIVFNPQGHKAYGLQKSSISQLSFMICDGCLFNDQ
ncbi:Hypothetical_protein [Hexamita inflata]|uniref:Hypothetical_protein n=1 Tax=Hexamita inflata TaxID=28002 RepID=A0AA86NY14_9EUKA|nr:Hypothetical protein HINF_LOCUS15068 [Hexamita inflata]